MTYYPSEQDRHEDALTAEETTQGKCLSCGNNLNASDNDPEFCADCQHQGGGIPTGETIDITPVGCQTPEGNARVNAAMEEWNGATHELANTLKRVIDEVFDRDLSKIAKAEYYSELQTLIGIREVKQEAFLRAVAGR